MASKSTQMESQTYQTCLYMFKEAYYTMGLLDDDKQYFDAIVETSNWGSKYYLLKLFATLVFSNQLSKLEYVWNNMQQYLTDKTTFAVSK